jgi:hypothetical protein
MQVNDGSAKAFYRGSLGPSEYHQSDHILPAPPDWKDGEVILTENGSTVSDKFLILRDPKTDLLTAYFVSEGAKPSKQALFDAAEAKFQGTAVVLPETGKFQDVSWVFGQARGFARILSQAASPEPASWALILVGFGLLGVMARRRRGASGAN